MRRAWAAGRWCGGVAGGIGEGGRIASDWLTEVVTRGREC